MEEELCIQKIQLRFNDNTLNQDISAQLVLSKAHPIVLERELYISKENAAQRDFIQLNELLLDISKNEGTRHDLAFLVKPYLQPQDDLLEINETKRKPVRIKEPIMFNIEPMPQKMKFRFEFDENRDQALLGDYYNVLVTMEPEDVTITDVSLQIEGVDNENCIAFNEGSASMDSQNLMLS